MTVCYVIIIVIIWKKSSIKMKEQTHHEKSRFRRFISLKRSDRNGRMTMTMTIVCILLILDDQQIESSIRNARSLGVIPRAKIKTVKMTLVIVIG